MRWGVNLPGVLLGAVVWALFCLGLSDAVPDVWIWVAFPVAVLVAYVLTRTRVKPVPALILILLFPWVIRGIVFIAAVALQMDLQVSWDMGWFLTAPLWYFAAISRYLVLRQPRYGYLEALVFSVIGGILIAFFLDQHPLLSVIQVERWRLFISIFVLILTMFSLLSTFRQLRGKSQGLRLSHHLIYWSSLTLLVIVLVLIGNKVRRAESLSSGGGLLSSDLFRFDFGDILSLEPQIELNAELTMLYREDGMPQVRYLRRFTLSGWDENRGFFRDTAMESDYPGGPPLPSVLPRGVREWRDPPFDDLELIAQEYYLVALDPASFFVLNSPVRVEPWKIWDDASFVRAYTVNSMVSFAKDWELEDAPSENLPDDYRTYLLSGGDSLMFTSLAKDILGEETNGWKKASAIEKWLISNYYYSLNPGIAPDGDQLAWFLNKTKRGYCSYFAFAMTRLCRAVGVPARVAVGFVTDPSTAVLGFIPVRSDQAHTWVEVWIENYGWIVFDPTSQTMAPGEDYPTRFLSPNEWLPLIEEVLTRRGEVSAVIEEANELSNQNPWWRDLFFQVKSFSAFTIGACILLLILLYAPGRLFPAIADLRNASSGNSRRRVKGRWRRFARRLLHGKMRPKPRETALEWARRVDDCGIEGFSEWTAIYLKAEFSGVFEPQDCKNAAYLEKRLLNSWKKSGWKWRILSALSPRLNSKFPWRSRS